MAEKTYKFVAENGALEESVQTVVIVDLNDMNFQPLYPSTPASLLPVNGKAAIEHTLEGLISCGLRRIMLIFTKKFEQVVNYVRMTRIYLSNLANIEFKNLVPCACASLGDVLRELNMDLTLHLRGEFLIINGILFNSFNLTSLVETHLKRRYADDRIVLTIVLYGEAAAANITDDSGDVYPSEPPVYVYQCPYSRLAAKTDSYTIKFPSNTPPEGHARGDNNRISGNRNLNNRDYNNNKSLNNRDNDNNRNVKNRDYDHNSCLDNTDYISNNTNLNNNCLDNIEYRLNNTNLNNRNLDNVDYNNNRNVNNTNNRLNTANPNNSSLDNKDYDNNSNVNNTDNRFNNANTNNRNLDNRDYNHNSCLDDNDYRSKNTNPNNSNLDNRDYDNDSNLDNTNNGSDYNSDYNSDNNSDNNRVNNRLNYIDNNRNVKNTVNSLHYNNNQINDNKRFNNTHNRNNHNNSLNNRNNRSNYNRDYNHDNNREVNNRIKNNRNLNNNNNSSINNSDLINDNNREINNREIDNRNKNNNNNRSLNNGDQINDNNRELNNREIDNRNTNNNNNRSLNNGDQINDNNRELNNREIDNRNTNNENNRNINNRQSNDKNTIINGLIPVKLDDLPFAVVDEDSGEILKLEPKKSEHIYIPLKNNFNKLRIKFLKYLDYSQIYLFDYRAIQLFTENFDFSTVEDFALNIIGDEVLMRGVCYDVIAHGYSEIMSDMRTYYRICFNELRRWAFPRTLDFNNAIPHKSQIYICESSKVRYSVKTTGPVSVGERCLIDENCRLENCIIGCDCVIGNNCVLINCIIWDNVIIEDNSAIDNSIVCDFARILTNTIILNGCLIGPKIVVGPRVVIPNKSIILTNRHEEVVGPAEIVDLGAESNGALFSLDSYHSLLYDWGPNTKTKSKIIVIPAKNNPAENGASDSDDEFGCDFEGSIKETVIRGIKNGQHCETIITEIIAQRCSFEENQNKLNIAARNSIIAFCIPPKLNDQSEIMQHIKDNSDLMAPFCKKFFSNTDSLISLVLGLEDSIYYRNDLRDIYSRLIMQLFYNDIVDFDFLTLLRDYHNDQWDEERRNFRFENIQRFMDFAEMKMKEQDDEDDDEEDDDEEESDGS